MIRDKVKHTHGRGVRNTREFPTTALQRRFTRYLRQKWFRYLQAHQGYYIGRCPVCSRDGQARLITLDGGLLAALQAAKVVANRRGEFRWNTMLASMGTELKPGYADLAKLGLIEQLRDHLDDFGRWQITSAGYAILRRQHQEPDRAHRVYVFDNEILEGLAA